MKALILAAGFGTGLEESFRDYQGQYKPQLEQWVAGKPKGLIIIKGKPVVQHQLEQLLRAGLTVEDIYVHTNMLYYPQYRTWATSAGLPVANIFRNAVRDNEHRLGAVADIQYALNYIPRDNLIIMASDTLLFSDKSMFDLRPIIEGYTKDKISRMIVYEGESHTLSRHGLVQVNDQGIVIGFEEKPAHPLSNLVNASVQLYTSAMVGAILQANLEPQAESGMIIAHLYPSFPIKVEKASSRLDIGAVEDVLQANILGEWP